MYMYHMGSVNGNQIANLLESLKNGAVGGHDWSEFRCT